MDRSYRFADLRKNIGLLELRGHRAGDHLRQREALWGDIAAYRKACRSTGCSNANLWELYRTLRWLRPAEVLECGPGLSTVAIAHALKKNADEGIPGRLTTMEDQAPFFEEHQKLCPEALRTYVDYVLSPKRDDAFYLFRGVRYADIPDKPYEFVFVDGPDHHAESDGEMACDLDFVRVVERSRVPVWGQIDGRITTVVAMQTILPKNAVRFDPRLGITYLGPVSRDDVPLWDAGMLYYENTMLRPDAGRYVRARMR